MSVSTNCITSPFDVYVPSTNKPWNEERVRHVYRRLGYDINIERIENALSFQPDVLIDRLVDNAFNSNPLPTPTWADFTYYDYQNLGLDFDEETQSNHQELRMALINEMQSNNSLRARLIMFWSIPAFPE